MTSLSSAKILHQEKQQQDHFFWKRNLKTANLTRTLTIWCIPRGLLSKCDPQKHRQGVSWSVWGASGERPRSLLRAAYSCISFTKQKYLLFWNKKHEDHKLNIDFGNMRPTDGPPWQKWAQKAFPGCVRERLGSLAGAAYLWHLLQLNKSQVFFEIFECRNYYKWPHNCSSQEASPESEKWAYSCTSFTQA